MRAALEELLAEAQELLPTEDETVRRELAFPDAPKLINVAIGMRRTGKTYLMFQTIRDLLKKGIPWSRILFLNFEDDRLLPMTSKKLAELIEAFYTLHPKNHKETSYLFLDEIQNVPGWSQVLRRIFDTKKVRMYLTGSSAKLLSTEIASSLRGRSIATEVWPYGLSGYLRAHELSLPSKPLGKQKMDHLKQVIKEFFCVGGFPAVQELHLSERRTVLQSYVDSVVFRDVIERHKITNTQLIKYLIQTLIRNIAAPFSVNKFYKDIKSQGYRVSKDTLYQYIDYLEDAFLISSVPLFTESLRKQQSNPKKIYLVDNGLASANLLGVSSKMGNLLENQVYLDLRRQGKKIHYYLTSSGYEIDFVVQSPDGSAELIQVVWTLEDSLTREREERALEEAKRELGLPGQILDLDQYLRNYCCK